MLPRPFPVRLVRLIKSIGLIGLIGLLFSTVTIGLLIMGRGNAIDLTALPPSQYASTMVAPFNQPSYYPIAPQPPAGYLPVSDWMGRLILPSVAEYEQIKQTTQETDWAWFEVETAPADAANLIGQTVRLAWIQEPLTQLYVQKASRDVRLAPEVEPSWQAGIIHPVRLAGRDRVGPLQSLAGGHPYDDVTVILKGQFQVEPGFPSLQTPTPIVLRVNREPLQATGRWVGLVKFLEPVAPTDPQSLPPQCPGELPCAPDQMRVQHYNLASQQFDGAIETIRIPQQPQDKDGVYNMTTRNLAQSPAGEAGWYIFGAPDAAGIFTVQAMQPRSIVLLPPQQTIRDLQSGLQYMALQNWADLDSRQGQIQTVQIAPAPPASPTQSWQVGDRFLLMHNYGGRGGSHANHESYVLGTYPGHFSFGTAQVIRDRFTDQLIFDIDYYQVYGNGGDGTLSGGQTWANYMGNLRRGPMGTRPISDTLIQFDALTQDYDFGGIQLSFFKELIGELSLIGARYRIGDGTGDSTITSATSCVQDSAQALLMTLVRFRDKVQNNPQIMDWIKTHPQDPTTLRFRELVRLAKDIADQLMPMGILRWDWRQNAEVLTGVRSDESFISIDDFQPKHLLTGLISWRTAMPRQAHDEFAMLFLHHGASLVVLRPNQIGGQDPTIAPLEPTLLLGAWTVPGTRVPLAAWLVIRLFGSLAVPSGQDWLIGGIALLGLGSGLALLQRRLRPALPDKLPAWLRSADRSPRSRRWSQLIRLLGIAALQETVFRVLLLFYPQPWIPDRVWWAWAWLGLGCFVAFQMIYGKWLRPALADSLTHPTFLVFMTLLGLTCTIGYRFTGSLWIITLLHWIAVSVWWLGLGWRLESGSLRRSAELKTG